VSEQFAFNLPARIDYSADSFVDGCANRDARLALERWRNWPRRVLALTGPASSGKSHLGSIWAKQSSAIIVRSADLSERLSQIATGAAVLVEDIDRNMPEQALFHAINRAAEGDIQALLLTARKPPVLWGSTLPDLTSRLRALPRAEMSEPDDELLTRVLEKQFCDRGTPIKPGVIEYLLPRMDRSIAAAHHLVERLDKRALAKKSAVTRTVARDVLEAWPDAELDPMPGAAAEQGDD
jgi:chromosomal replication initiation ATPase DnaA